MNLIKKVLVLHCYTLVVVLLDVALVLLGSQLDGSTPVAYIVKLLPAFVVFNLLVITLGSLAIFNWFEKQYRHQVESLLASDQQKLRLMEHTLDHSSELVYWISRDYKIVHVNRHALLILGYERQELLNRPISLIDSELSSNRIDQLWVYLKSGHHYVLESSQTTKAGVSIPVETVLNYCAYGEEEFLCAFVRDVSERKQNQNELYENQAFLEATINQSPVGIIILDGKTTNIKVCNTGAKMILGISFEDDLVGKTVSFDGLIWEVLTPERTAFPLEQNPLYKAFFHETTSNDKMIIRRADGGERFVLINSGPIYDKKGEFIAAIVAFLDITELKETQDRLEEFNKNLEEKVSERTFELLKTNETLSTTIEDLKRTQNQLIEAEKFASLGSLVAGVAHEINTPVGVGVTAASYLRESTNSLSKLYSGQLMKKSELESYLAGAVQSTQIILTNLERASNLIKSFKMISVDQSTDQKRRFKPVEYFEEVFLSLHPPDKRLLIALKIDGDPEMEIISYPGAFSQIITNLYMNSCIHGFEGRNEGSITLSFAKNGDKLEVVYQDNGRGMDAQTLKKIYEPFFTTRRDLGGSGLGMNIVFNLVNQKLGGRILADSRPGEGAKFQMEIPL